MPRSIIEEITVYEESDLEPDDFTDPGGEPIPYSVKFYEHFTSREIEDFIDGGYLGFTRQELIELRDKITEVL